MTYEEREQLKAENWPKVKDEMLNLDERVQAADWIMFAWFCRSVGAYGDRPGHPTFYRYRQMLLKQGAEACRLPQDVYDECVKKFGTCYGIPKGSYYHDT